AVATLDQRLAAHPFQAPEAYDLADLRLGAKELAAAARQGRLLRLPGEVILAPAAPALAMRELSRLPQPFTLSQARVALGPTRRLASGHRETVRCRVPTGAPPMGTCPPGRGGHDWVA